MRDRVDGAKENFPFVISHFSFVIAEPVVFLRPSSFEWRVIRDIVKKRQAICAAMKNEKSKMTNGKSLFLIRLS